MESQREERRKGRRSWKGSKQPGFGIARPRTRARANVAAGRMVGSLLFNSDRPSYFNKTVETSGAKKVKKKSAAQASGTALLFYIYG